METKIKRAFALIFKRWNEYLPLLIALPTWWFSSYVTRLIDPTAAVDDAGLFQALVFGLVLYFAACAFSFMAMRVVFPVLGRFVDDYMGSVFINKIDDTNRIWTALVLFAIYFFGAIIIFASVI